MIIEDLNFLELTEETESVCGAIANFYSRQTNISTIKQQSIAIAGYGPISFNNAYGTGTYSISNTAIAANVAQVQQINA